MLYQASALKGSEDDVDWLICKDRPVNWRRGTREDRLQDHDQVPLTDLCCRTKQDLSRERGTCCCWCRRHSYFWPDGGLDYQPAKLCLFMVLRVCYSVPMGSRCQNSAVIQGLMGGLLMQIARGCIGKLEGNCAEILECAGLERRHVRRCRRSKRKRYRAVWRKLEIFQYFDGQGKRKHEPDTGLTNPN